jgi:hypothetical protein
MQHARLIETLGIDGTSSDEEAPDRKGVFLIKRRRQIDESVHHLKGCV